jgi:hypothetical protein
MDRRRTNRPKRTATPNRNQKHLKICLALLRCEAGGSPRASGAGIDGFSNFRATFRQEWLRTQAGRFVEALVELHDLV